VPILKGLAKELYSRVVLAWKPTLLGFALALADAAVSYLQLAQLPSWAHWAVGLVATALALYKGGQGRTDEAIKGSLLGVLVGCVVAANLSGCATVKSIFRSTVDCSRSPLAEQGALLAGAAYDALSKPATNWKPAMEQIALAAGEDLAVCAVRAVVAELDKKPTATQGSALVAAYLVAPGPRVALDADAYLHAKEWLADRGQ